MISELEEHSSTENISRPGTKSYKGKGKMREYEVDHPDDSDSDVSACSLDSEFGVPIMWTPGVKNGSHIGKRKTPPLITSEEPSHSACLQRVYGPSLCLHDEGSGRTRARKPKPSPQAWGGGVELPRKGRTAQSRAKAEESRKPHGNRTTTQRPKKAESRMEIELPHKVRRKPKAARMLTKPKKVKPDVGHLTLELKGACWDIKLN